jgi:hypothetical protein
VDTVAVGGFESKELVILDGVVRPVGVVMRRLTGVDVSDTVARSRDDSLGGAFSVGGVMRSGSAGRGAVERNGSAASAVTERLVVAAALPGRWAALFARYSRSLSLILMVPFESELDAPAELPLVTAGVDGAGVRVPEEETTPVRVCAAVLDVTARLEPTLMEAALLLLLATGARPPRSDLASRFVRWMVCAYREATTLTASTKAASSQHLHKHIEEKRWILRTHLLSKTAPSASAASSWRCSPFSSAIPGEYRDGILSIVDHVFYKRAFALLQEHVNIYIRTWLLKIAPMT